MVDSALRVQQAAALHRQAAALVDAASAALDADGSSPDPREQHHLAEDLRAAAGALAPGWLGAPLDAQSVNTPLGGVYPPQFVRLGAAQLLDDNRFPAIVPLLGTGHLTIDATATDARVFGLLRSILRPVRCWSARSTASAAARCSRPSPICVTRACCRRRPPIVRACAMCSPRRKSGCARGAGWLRGAPGVTA